MKAIFEQPCLAPLAAPARAGRTALLEPPSAPASHLPEPARLPPARFPMSREATPCRIQPAVPPPGLAGARTPKPRPARGGGSQGIISALLESKLYQDYERAFAEATGLPLVLRPVESWQIPLHGKRHEAPYCALMSATSRACASCLQMQERLAQSATHRAETVQCAAGLSETAVPVRLGERLIGFLQTGQVFSRKPTARQFERTAAALADSGLDRGVVKQAYFATRVMAPRQQASATTLLTIFAEHLAMLSNRLIVQQEHAEPPAITKAKAFIDEHLTEELRLEQVAKFVGMSSYYFCKVFRRAAGVNFTDYLSRVRIERAKNLLLNPHLRISEIAYEVGFQSLTHFNRVFRRVLGQSPTQYRSQLLGRRPAGA
jgi:AraC-like DNA-binding protein